jgi:hypothetical protein
VENVPATPLIAAAFTIVLGNKKMLIRVNDDEELELPGLVIASEEKAVQSIQDLMKKMGLDGFPQQTLYLTKIQTSSSKTKKTPAFIRVVPLEKTLSLNFPKAKFKPVLKVECDDQATALTRVVAQWLILKFEA